ncbi:winged helix-turn-helix domain-containing protein [Photobacterium lipolyticum]|uniref:Winged helix family transcriptional regulator n=1 Tax=Photobacterium lipolyticum TaxID=266810 RepID=A0A2T3MTE9_9GAMM|nr:winged helix-turn-helix domain-containing protein [Photobacterium lipolyticum]PSW02583.1 winged helix family transcriptional regulator [Photobacterium lipolyticum]
MKYKINAFLNYDATDGSLKLDDTGKSDTKLSITANALLYVLIQNPGIMSRDDVMKKVWDDNGLVSSNSNLNQYICLLRKAFRSYGIENIIVTIPKARLEINPELKIEVVDDNMLHPIFQQQAVSKSSHENEQSVPEYTDISLVADDSGDKYWGYASVVIFMLAFAVFWVSIFSERPLQMMTLTPVEHSQCELLSTEAMINAAVKDSYGKSFDAVKGKLALDCGKEERFLFYYGDKLQTNGLGRTFLAHCAENEDNPFSYCDNYFYYSWK